MTGQMGEYIEVGAFFGDSPITWVDNQPLYFKTHFMYMVCLNIGMKI